MLSLLSLVCLVYLAKGAPMQDDPHSFNRQDQGLPWPMHAATSVDFAIARVFDCHMLFTRLSELPESGTFERMYFDHCYDLFKSLSSAMPFPGLEEIQRSLTPQLCRDLGDFEYEIDANGEPRFTPSSLSFFQAEHTFADQDEQFRFLAFRNYLNTMTKATGVSASELAYIDSWDTDRARRLAIIPLICVRLVNQPADSVDVAAIAADEIRASPSEQILSMLAKGLQMV